MRTALATALALIAQPAAAAACDNWDVEGQWSIIQANKITVAVNVVQDGDELAGTASYQGINGTLEGYLDGDTFKIRVSWERDIPNCHQDGLMTTACVAGDKFGIYEGTVGGHGDIEGSTWPFENPNAVRQSWFSKNLQARCPIPAKNIALDAPKILTVDFDVPPKVDSDWVFGIAKLSWSKSVGAVSYEVMRSPWSGYKAPPAGSFKFATRTEGTGYHALVFSPEIIGTKNVFFKVCAVNGTERKCSRIIPAKPLPRHVSQATSTESLAPPRLEVNAGAASVLNNTRKATPTAKFVRNVPLTLDANRNETCAAGYVWREGSSSDHVCVTPESRERTAVENGSASERWFDGAYGPHTCTSGFVWREAFNGDDVCVDPDVRTIVKQENAQAADHRL